MYYNVTYKHDEKVVHLAESTSLAEMRQLAELICRNALPEVCSVSVENGAGELVYVWAATPQTSGKNAILQPAPDGGHVN